MARSARSNYESNSDEFDVKRLAVMGGGGLAVVLVVVILGFKMFSSNDTPKPVAPPVAHAPEYPLAVTDLIARTEEAFKSDDFKAARADVDQLRQLSPSHPRLAFFEGLLTSRADGTKSASSGRGASKKNGQPSHKNESSVATAGNVTPPATGARDALSRAGSPGDGGASASVAAASGDAGSTSGVHSPPGTASSSADTAGLPAETPVGLSKVTSADSGAQHGAAGASSVGTSPAGGSPAAASSAGTTTASAPPVGGAPAAALAANSPLAASAGSAAAPASPPAAATSAATSASSHRAASEPPPVVQEAKLIRRVTPDYPSAARKEGIVGSVDLDVTVSTQGIVEDVSVVQATPPDLFEKSALAAVRKWKYDPRFVDGLPSQTHLKVHLDFGPNR